MPGETLSFLAGGSTSGLVRPAAYDTIDVPKIENSKIRKITHDARTTPPASERLVQRSSMDVRCYHGSVGHGWRVVEMIHTESGETECVSIVEGNAKVRCTGSVLKCGVW
jgi:hypothetical protein